MLKIKVTLIIHVTLPHCFKRAILIFVIAAIITRMRGVLHEGQLGVRVQYMVEVMLAIIKDDFKDHPSIMSELDLVKEDDQFTHMLQLDEVTAGQELLSESFYG